MEKREFKKILVKMPVRLGDTIMASYLVRALNQRYPSATIDLIMGKHVVELVAFMPFINHVYSFSKVDFPGVRGNIRFGKMIRRRSDYDLFFCIPYSLSSALTGFFTGCKVRVGFDTEFRRLLLTHTFKPKKDLHEVEEINSIFERFTGEKIAFTPLRYRDILEKRQRIITSKWIAVNIMANQESRIIPAQKTISLIKSFLQHFPHDIILTGAVHEMAQVGNIAKEFSNEPRVRNMSGKTTLLELATLLSQCQLLISTDTGNAHLANALAVPTVVLFGSGDSNRSRPYESDSCIVLKASELSCIPCMSEKCKFNDTRCLTSIPDSVIINAAVQLLNSLKS